jgi:dTDP-glucose pyrophosphorylase
MLELAGKPVIEYSLGYATRCDLTEIVIVVGYGAEEVINAFGNRYGHGPIKYVIQREQRGLVDAIEASKEAIGNDDFMLFLGDEVLVNPRHTEMVNKFKEEELFGVCGVVVERDPTRISKTYSVIQDDRCTIHRLIEKPRKPVKNNLMGTGNCIFRSEILSYIDETPINHHRGEKELPDLIQCAVDDGNTVKSFVLGDMYFNVNSLEDLEEARARLLPATEESRTGSKVR